MSFVNHASKEVHAKIVYFGAGLSGKTTNIQYIYDHTSHDLKGKLFSAPSENERTLFFDFLPLGIGPVEGYQTRFHLFSIPGQTFYELSQQFLLKGVDGIVFVVDSQEERMEANVESFGQLQKNLLFQGYEFSKIPLVFQYNKRDLPSAVQIEELEKLFNSAQKPWFEATAHRGDGVIETLQSISKGVLKELRGVPSV